jgi:anti-sigma factor RsiW
MTDPKDIGHISDEQLIAYLDRELSLEEHATLARRIAGDPELQRRLLVLSGGNRPFRQAFEPLLAHAPEERMKAMLSNLQATSPASRAPRWRVLGAMAAAILLFAAGLAADRLLTGSGPSLGDITQTADRGQDDDDWRQAVAEYLTLYSTDTLASIPDDDVMRQRELESLKNKLALNLSSSQLATPGLSFKRAQLFEYDGKPLGQIAYLDPDSGPVALCMIRSDGGGSGQQTEQRQGFNIVYWTQSGHDFMVIGRMSLPQLQDLARDLSGRLAI